jgi:hypothetical protein
VANDEGQLRDPGEPSFREKLVDFVSALVLVVMTILTAWNFSLPFGPSLHASAADQPTMQYPAIPGPAFVLDPGADTDALHRRSAAAQDR